MHAEAAHPAWRRAFAALVLLWALGTVLAEGVEQAAAGGMVLLCLLRARRLSLAPDVRQYVGATLALALWQALSPALALLTGAAQAWPRSSRYGQVLDTLAPAALAALGPLGVPWLALAGVLAGGWLAAGALGLFQHLVRWPFTPPALIKVPLARLHENFGTAERPRYAASGFLFHRLRFAHAAVATLGPALALLARERRPRWQVLAALVVGVLVLVPFGAFARAALGCALLVSGGAALLLLPRGRGRGVALLLAVAAVGAVALSPAWRARVTHGMENLFGGERTVAMAAGLRLVSEHPVLGVGFGNHRPAAMRGAAGTELTEFLANDAHSVWLTVWAETGLIGVLLLLAAHLSLARALWRRHRAGSPAASGGLLALGAFHVLGLVHYLPFHPSVHLCFGLFWGLGLCGGDAQALAPAQREAAPDSSARS